MEIDTAALALAFGGGVLAGAGYLTALWVAVSGLAGADRPAVRLLGGAALRIGLLLGAFLLVSDGRWDRLLACLAGFVVVRLAVTRWVGAGAPRAAR